MVAGEYIIHVMAAAFSKIARNSCDQSAVVAQPAAVQVAAWGEANTHSFLPPYPAAN